MIYELRTYWPSPGKLEALHERFRSLTLRIFARYNMQVVGFWTPAEADEAGDSLVYMLTFPDEDTMRRAWEAFRADPEWRTGKAASEADGALTARVESRVLLPTNYSPLA